jgi:hypothetical protein
LKEIKLRRKIMVSVLEYGEDIGTLKNLFLDQQQAIEFARMIIDLSDNEYEYIGSNQWYCYEKREYIEIEGE